eukprot:scaffold248270_cov43-Prasinocladus_malaysianus.AAC.1
MFTKLWKNKLIVGILIQCPMLAPNLHEWEYPQPQMYTSNRMLPSFRGYDNKNMSTIPYNDDDM